MKKIILLAVAFICLSSVAFADTGAFAAVKLTFLNQDPDPAQTGKYVELRWKVDKLGNEELKEITFFLDVKYPFSFDESDTPERLIGDWTGYSGDKDYYTLFYRLRVDDKALEDNYTVVLRSRYSKVDSWATNEYPIRVAKKDESQFVLGTLASSPTKLVSDTDEARLDVELENIGDGDAQNVNAQIVLPAGFTPSYGYSDRSNIGEIAAGDSETAAFYVDVADNVTGGSHYANLIIRYREADDDKHEYKLQEMPLEIPIKDKPSFDLVSVETLPDAIKKNDDVELKLKIRNTGGADAESVSVRAFKESSQPFEFDEKSDFIGNLAKGDVGEAILKFKVQGTATAKNYLLDLEIRSIYGDSVLIEEKTLPIRVTDDMESQGSILTGAIIVLVIVLVGLGAFYLGRSKRKR